MIFRFISRENVVGSLRITLLGRPMILIDVSYHSKGRNRGPGSKPSEMFSESRLFHLRETPFLMKRVHYKRAIFINLLRKAEA